MAIQDMILIDEQDLSVDDVPLPHLLLLEALDHCEDALHHAGHVQEVQRLRRTSFNNSDK